MSTKLEQQIRERAYHLWLLDGCPHDRADEYWFSAERQALALASEPVKAKKRATAKRAEALEPSRQSRSKGKRKTNADAPFAGTRL